VMAAANNAAKQGTPALTEWWRSLSKEDRSLIDSNTIKSLKAAAKEADGASE